jgi:hypothetical protein
MTVTELAAELSRIAKEGMGDFEVVDEHRAPVDWVMRGGPREVRERRVVLMPEVDI